MAAREEEDLATHTALCHLRYQQLEMRIEQVETKLDQVSNEVKQLKDQSDKNFSELKTLISNQKDEKFKVMITATATVIVGLLGMLGYVITHLPK